MKVIRSTDTRLASRQGAIPHFSRDLSEFTLNGALAEVCSNVASHLAITSRRLVNIEQIVFEPRELIGYLERFRIIRNEPES